MAAHIALNAAVTMLNAFKACLSVLFCSALFCCVAQWATVQDTHVGVISLALLCLGLLRWFA